MEKLLFEQSRIKEIVIKMGSVKMGILDRLFRKGKIIKRGKSGKIICSICHRDLYECFICNYCENVICNNCLKSNHGNCPKCGDWCGWRP